MDGMLEVFADPEGVALSEDAILAHRITPAFLAEQQKLTQHSLCERT